MLDTGFAEDLTMPSCLMCVKYAVSDTNYGICKTTLEDSSKRKSGEHARKL